MINIFCGATQFAPERYMFEELKSNRDCSNNIFVVPDRYTLSTEKNIFEYLDITSAFDIDVLTLSRLASRLMPNYQVLSKSVSIMIVRKLLQDNKQKFKCFNKTLLTSGFAENIKRKGILNALSEIYMLPWKEFYLKQHMGYFFVVGR